MQYFLARLLGWDDGPGDPIEGTLRVAPDGRVYLTAYVDDDRFVLGDLHQERLHEIGGRPVLAEWIRRAEARRAHPPGACAACRHRWVCGGGSPARAFAVHGTLEGPDEFCEAKQAFLEAWYRSLA
nr:SPASM domain-containing protein [Dissulfurirhabdus thermomarina]